MEEIAKLNNPYEVINKAEKGVPVALFDALVEESGYQKAVVAEFIGLNVKTISNYRRQGKLLKKTEAEHFLKLKELFLKGKGIFNNMEEFKGWLTKPAYGLGGRIPKTLLKYISGIDLVKRELLRIEYGDFS